MLFTDGNVRHDKYSHVDKEKAITWLRKYRRNDPFILKKHVQQSKDIFHSWIQFAVLQTLVSAGTVWFFCVSVEAHLSENSIGNTWCGCCVAVLVMSWESTVCKSLDSSQSLADSWVISGKNLCVGISPGICCCKPRKWCRCQKYLRKTANIQICTTLEASSNMTLCMY